MPVLKMRKLRLGVSDNQQVFTEYLVWARFL